MARRIGLSSNEFWSLTPAQFDMFVDDWWEDEYAARLQVAQLESTLVNISRTWGLSDKDPVPELTTAPDLVTMKRRNSRPGMVKTVEGWVTEDELRASKARVQQEAERVRNDKIAGIYRG